MLILGHNRYTIGSKHSIRLFSGVEGKTMSLASEIINYFTLDFFLKLFLPNSGTFK